jgi:nucleotide-binding universal stress UspA family protein
MKNILVPTDFSDNSWNAIKYGMSLFKKIPCNFYLLNVTLITTYSTGEYPLIPTTEIIETKLLKQAKESLEEMVKKMKKIATNKAHNFFTISVYNHFIDAVRDCVEQKKIDLIVMGTKGATGLSEIIIGSNTGNLITQIHCPVLIVPENARFKKPKEIAFPTDYNIFYAPEILNKVTDLATQFNATVRIVHITKKGEELTAFQMENKEFLNTFFMDEKHSFHKLTSKKVEDGIQCFVQSRDIDIIVMVAKNLNLFQRILFKPTVEEISYHTDIPFLVLHE